MTGATRHLLLRRSIATQLLLLAMLALLPSISAAQMPTTTAHPSKEREALFQELNEQVDAFQTPFALVKKVAHLIRPSVVHLEAVKFESRNGRRRRVEEAGAGVIVQIQDKDYILTNRHVIKNAKLSDILVRLDDGRFFHPVKVWTDPETDIAIAVPPSLDLTACRAGDSDQIDIGDFVVAVGSPFGLNHSVTCGIISAKGRRDLQLGDEGVRYQDFMQTDAAINPGNSGGPLVNLRGEVIGINTAIASNSGSNEGIGFTIPINMVMNVASQLVEKGQVTRAFLGVSLDMKYSAKQASQLGLSRIYGARVSAITQGSPADQADIEIGDVILEFNGAVVEDDSHLVNQVSVTPIGQDVPMLVYRDGQKKVVTVTVTDRKRFRSN